VAVSVYGIPNSINGAKFAKLLGLQGSVNNVHGVTGAALLASVASGNRRVDVETGDAIVGGVLLENSSRVQLTLDTNTSGQPRIDTVVAQVGPGSITTAGSITVITGTPGSSPSPPQLTQVLGSSWQMPIAHVTVPNNATQLTAANVVDVRPRPRFSIVYKVTPPGGVTRTSGQGSPFTVATISVPDPGWPYRLEVLAAQNFQSTSQGFGTLTVDVDAVVLETGRTDVGCTVPAQANNSTTTRTGTATVRHRIHPTNLGGSDSLVTSNAHSHLTVIVHPAVA